MAACTRQSLKLVKLCDLIEAISFLEVEGMGVHAQEVGDKIAAQIGTMIANEGWGHILNEVHDLLESQ